MKALLAKNTSLSVISKRLGVSKGAISKYKNKWFSQSRRNKGGRPAKISKATKSLMRRKVLSGALLTARDVHKELVNLGYDLTWKTATNILKSMDFCSGIKKKKPFLSSKHKAARFSWAKRHEHWTKDDWKRVVFSDETKINVWGSDGCKYYWSRPGDDLKPHHLDLTVKHGGGSIMMWGCMTYWGSGYACQVYGGTMKSEDYQHILDTTYRDTMEYYSLDWSAMHFQDDNDPKHRSASTKNGLKNRTLRFWKIG